MTIRIQMRNEMCSAVDRYCRKHYGPRSFEYEVELSIREKMVLEFSAKYEFDRDILCDVIVFEDEADYLIFKLRVL